MSLREMSCPDEGFRSISSDSGQEKETDRLTGQVFKGVIRGGNTGKPPDSPSGLTPLFWPSCPPAPFLFEENREQALGDSLSSIDDMEEEAGLPGEVRSMYCCSYDKAGSLLGGEGFVTSKAGSTLAPGEGFNSSDRGAERGKDRHMPSLCYLRLPSVIKNYEIRTAEGVLISNVFDYVTVRNSLYNCRHNDGQDYWRGIRNNFKQSNYFKGQKGSTNGSNYQGNSNFSQSNCQDHSINAQSLKNNQNNAQNRGLQFDSLYNNGNLLAAVRSCQTENTYFLEVNPDTNSQSEACLPPRHFNFTFSGGQPGSLYTFHICNLRKDSWKEGVQPFMKSWREGKGRQVNSKYPTRRIEGTSLFRPNSLLMELFEQEGLAHRYSNSTLYTLTFTVKVENRRDKLTISSGLVYTYEDIQKDFLRWGKACEELSDHTCIRKNLLCFSVLNKKVHYFTICKRIYKTGLKDKKKPYVLISCRSRPCDSGSSFAMKGFVDFLLDANKPESKFLRQHFNFIVVPCMSTDGILVGNSNVGIAGLDPENVVPGPQNKSVFPEIYYFQRLMLKLANQGDTVAFSCHIENTFSEEDSFFKIPMLTNLNENQKIDKLKMAMFYFESFLGFQVNACRFEANPNPEQAITISQMTRKMGSAESLTFTISAHKRHSHGFEHSGYVSLGSELCLTLANHLFHKIPKENTPEYRKKWEWMLQNEQEYLQYANKEKIKAILPFIKTVETVIASEPENQPLTNREKNIEESPMKVKKVVLNDPGSIGRSPSPQKLRSSKKTMNHKQIDEFFEEIKRSPIKCRHQKEVIRDFFGQIEEEPQNESNGSAKDQESNKFSFGQILNHRRCTLSELDDLDHRGEVNQMAVDKFKIASPPNKRRERLSKSPGSEKSPISDCSKRSRTHLNRMSARRRSEQLSSAKRFDKIIHKILPKKSPNFKQIIVPEAPILDPLSCSIEDGSRLEKSSEEYEDINDQIRLIRDIRTFKNMEELSPNHIFETQTHRPKPVTPQREGLFLEKEDLSDKTPDRINKVAKKQASPNEIGGSKKSPSTNTFTCSIAKRTELYNTEGPIPVSKINSSLQGYPFKLSNKNESIMKAANLNTNPRVSKVRKPAPGSESVRNRQIAINNHVRDSSQVSSRSKTTSISEVLGIKDPGFAQKKSPPLSGNNKWRKAATIGGPKRGSKENQRSPSNEAGEGSKMTLGENNSNALANSALLKSINMKSLQAKTLNENVKSTFRSREVIKLFKKSKETKREETPDKSNLHSVEIEARKPESTAGDVSHRPPLPKKAHGSKPSHVYYTKGQDSKSYIENSIEQKKLRLQTSESAKKRRHLTSEEKRNINETCDSVKQRARGAIQISTSNKKKFIDPERGNLSRSRAGTAQKDFNTAEEKQNSEIRIVDQQPNPQNVIHQFEAVPEDHQRGVSRKISNISQNCEERSVSLNISEQQSHGNRSLERARHRFRSQKTFDGKMSEGNVSSNQLMMQLNKVDLNEALKETTSARANSVPKKPVSSRLKAAVQSQQGIKSGLNNVVRLNGYNIVFNQKLHLASQNRTNPLRESSRLRGVPASSVSRDNSREKTNMSFISKQRMVTNESFAQSGQRTGNSSILQMDSRLPDEETSVRTDKSLEKRGKSQGKTNALKVISAKYLAEKANKMTSANTTTIANPLSTTNTTTKNFSMLNPSPAQNPFSNQPNPSLAPTKTSDLIMDLVNKENKPFLPAEGQRTETRNSLANSPFIQQFKTARFMETATGGIYGRQLNFDNKENGTSQERSIKGVNSIQACARAANVYGLTPTAPAGKKKDTVQSIKTQDEFRAKVKKALKMSNKSLEAPSDSPSLGLSRGDN